MLKQKHYDMGVTELANEIVAVRKRKTEALHLLGVAENDILEVLAKDLELKEMTELVIDKARDRKIKREAKKIAKGLK